MIPLLLSTLVVYLLKSVIALIVTPINEDGPVIDTRAILAPTFETDMGLGQGSYGRSLPGEIALGPVSAKDYSRAAIAVTVTTGFMLPRIANIKDADGPHEVEFRSADIDVCAILNVLKSPVGWNEIVNWRGLERPTVVGPVQNFKYAPSVV
ncbi:hypothetical protein A3728_09340 [Sulfitobacter sp. HI0040]|jgi:hypothetical protein|nr:hypothetical protein A3721_07540 [Sulfitobacter sp. HI0023]KZY23221.1 hypothetical protein A3728_09340 [Sulfitobacter sp. HI0040]